MSTSNPAFGKFSRLYLLLFLLTATIVISCKKIDQLPAEKSSSVKQESKFFTNHAPTDPLVKSVLVFVKRENEKHQFVDNLIKKIGYPYWDKAIVAAGSSGSSARGTADSINTVFIPFVMDSANTVNTTLIVRTSPSDTNFLLIADWQYANQFYGSPTVDSTAESVALLFMMEDKNVFGYNRFTITDSNLFRTLPVLPGSNGREIRLSNPNGRSGGQHRMELEYEVEVCFNSYVCNYTDYCSQHSSCDYMNCISSINPCHLVSSACFYYTYDVDTEQWSNGSGGGPEGGGGGGSGWNNWEPPVCEEPTGGRLNQYQDCDPGWTPPGIDVPIEAEDPCNSTDGQSGATATLQYLNLKSTAQQFTAFNPNVTNQPEQYFLVNAVNGSNVPGTIQTLPTTGGSMQGVTSNTVMVVHTHPYGGFPSPSPGDFFDLAGFGSNFQMNYVIAFDGTKYAMIVNSYSQLQAFVAANAGAISSTGGFTPNTTNAGDDWYTIVSLLGQQGYTEQQAYERALAYIMKQAGVTLVKANAGSDTFKKIGIRQKMNPDGSPVVNANGDPVYENADC